jgi:PTS system cellobiose-specific IIC component
MSSSSDESKRSSAGSNHPSGRLDAAFARFEKTLVPIAHVLSESPVVTALRTALPWSFVGLVVGFVAFFAYAEHGTLVERAIDAFSRKRLTLTIDCAFTAMALALVGVLSAMTARRATYPIVLFIGTVVVAFVLALPQPKAFNYEAYARLLGASGLFLAIVVVSIAAGAFSIGRRRAGSVGMIGGAAAVVVVAGIAFLAHFSLASVIAAAIAPLGTLGDSFFALFVIAIFQAMLWIVGIHGPALVAAVVTPVYLRLQVENTAAFANHTALPHIVVVSTFLFVFPGGAGATLSLVLWLARSKIVRLRRIGLAALLPGVFNTNEPLILGLPIVFNPYFAIPFVLAPAVLVCTTYFAMAANLVGRPISYVPYSIPTLIACIAATLDWRAGVLAVVNVGLAGAVYYPFVRIYERAERAREANGAAAA